MNSEVLKRLFSNTDILTTQQRLAYGITAMLFESLVYFLIPLVQWHQAYLLPRSHWDFAIPFEEWAVVPYVSFYFLILTAFLKSSAAVVPALCRNIIIVACIAAFFYFFFPTTIERTDILLGDDTLSRLITFLYHMDTPFNCFPSQHCALAVVCVAALIDTNKVTNTLYFLWGVAIIWSTLAVQQHVMIDAVAGTLIGLVVYYYGNKLDTDKMDLTGFNYNLFK